MGRETATRAGGGTKPARRAWTTRQRKAAVAVALACVLGVYGGYRWWVGPDHRIGQFAAAVNRRDWGSMMALASRQEVLDAALDANKLRSLVEGGGRWAGSGWQLTSATPFPYESWQRPYLRGARYRVPTPRPGLYPTLPVDVTAYNTDDGWRIAVTQFASSLAGGQDYARLCLYLGMRPAYYSPNHGGWYDMATQQITQQGVGLKAGSH